MDLDFDYVLHTAVTYLAGQGHRHIALINGPTALYEKSLGYIIRYKQAFHHTMHDHGLVGIDSLATQANKARHNATTALLATHPPITIALITTNTWVVGGIIRALTDLARKVPEVIFLLAIISPRLAEITTPTLTTVDFPFATMGHLAASMLIDQLEGEQREPHQLLLKSDLTVRRSTGPCRSREKAM